MGDDNDVIVHDIRDAFLDVAFELEDVNLESKYVFGGCKCFILK